MVTLPDNCAGCGFRHEGEPSLCRRHAPGPVQKSGSTLQRAKWPTLPTAQRCGEGDTDGVIIACGVGNCIYWAAVEIQPAPPMRKPKTMWEELATLKEDPERYREFGRCTRYTMSPTDATVEMEHRITHGREDGCGDGALPHEEDEDGDATQEHSDFR